MYTLYTLWVNFVYGLKFSCLIFLCFCYGDEYSKKEIKNKLVWNLATIYVYTQDFVGTLKFIFFYP